MPALQKMKQLYVLKIDDSKVIVRGAYSLITNKTTVQTVKEYDKQFARSKAKIKILPTYRILKTKSTCTILKQHAEELKNDPNRLSTDFIQKLIKGEI